MITFSKQSFGRDRYPKTSKIHADSITEFQEHAYKQAAATHILALLEESSHHEPHTWNNEHDLILLHSL